MEDIPIKCKTPIAILMAAYNAEKYIAEQIDSIIDQANQEWTLYIRNDGSTDSTQKVIDSYTDTYPDKIIQIDKGGENLGCNKNFYRLLEYIESDYYMFCDSDDVWIQDRVEKMMSKIKSVEMNYPQTPVLVQSDSEIVDENLNMISHSLWETYKISDFQLTDYNSISVKCTTGGASSIFNHLTKDVFFPIPDNKRLMYDHWLGMQTSKHGIIVPLRIQLNKYRQHSGQVCGLTDKKSFLSRLFQLNRNIKHLIKDAQMLKDIGYGNYSKFFYYRIKSYFFYN